MTLINMYHYDILWDASQVMPAGQGELPTDDYQAILQHFKASYWSLRPQEDDGVPLVDFKLDQRYVISVGTDDSMFCVYLRDIIPLFIEDGYFVLNKGIISRGLKKSAP